MMKKSKLGVVAGLAVGLLSTGCSNIVVDEEPATPQTVVVHQPQTTPVYADESGVAYGQSLARIRHAKHRNHYRIVFDIDDPRGREPYALADYDPYAHAIDVELVGVHGDLTPGAKEQATWLGRGKVAYLARHAHQTAPVIYRVQLDQHARYRMFTLTSPPRVVLDIY